MSSSSVQYWGIPATVQAYRNRRVPAFAIWCGKQMNFAYDGYSGEENEEYEKPNIETGAEILTEYLNSLAQQFSISNAQYTLKVYDDLAGKKIKPSTDYTNGYNFKLTENVMSGMGNNFMPMQAYGQQFNNPLLEEVKQMREEMELMRTERMTGHSEEDDDDEGILGLPPAKRWMNALVGLIENPDKLKSLIQSGQEIGLIPMRGNNLAGIGSARDFINKERQMPWERVTEKPVTDQQQQQPANGLEQPVYTEELQTRLVNAINTLEKNDNNLVEHLEMLANISERTPEKFKMLLSMLQTFK